MTQWKMPPQAKVYEALSALEDGRLRIVEPGRAEVVSSSGDKVYSVEWSEDGRQVSSNDNASVWQGYIGYPIIAVLLATGRIPYDREVAKPLAGVPWHAVNELFKRDYAAAVESVLRDIDRRGGDRQRIESEVEAIYRQLEELGLERGPRRAPRKKKDLPNASGE
jgi:hypothetical protein